MDRSRQDPSAAWRTALWILVIVAASLGFGRAFACATPFVALATLAATQMPARAGALAVGLAWLANQAIGFLLLGYPHTGETLVWGLAIGLAAMQAFVVASRAASIAKTPMVGLATAFAAAFLGYEALLYVTALILSSGTGAFTVAIIARILLVNAVALVGLLAMHGIATATRLMAPTRRPRPIEA